MPIVLDKIGQSFIKPAAKPKGIVLDEVGKSLLSKPKETPNAPNPQESLTSTQKVLTNPIVDTVLSGFSKVAKPEPVVAPQAPMVGAMPPNRTRTPITSFLEGIMGSNPIESLSRTQAAMKGLEQEPGVNLKPNNYQDVVDRQRMREGAPTNVSVGEAIQTPMAGLMAPMMKANPAALATMMTGLIAKEKVMEPLREQIPEGIGKDAFDLGNLAADFFLGGKLYKFGENPNKAVADIKTKGVEKDFEADFAKVDPMAVRAKLKEANHPSQNASDQEIMAGLKNTLLKNPKVGDYYMAQQKPIKLTSDALETVGVKGERGSLGGERAEGFKDAENRFSALHDKKTRFEIDDSQAKYIRPKKFDIESVLDGLRKDVKPYTDKWWRGEATEEEKKSLDDISRKITDSEAQLKASEKIKVGDVLDHPELFKQYPWAKDINLEFTSVKQLQGSGSYDSKNNLMTLNKSIARELPDEARSVLLHEVQHAIQEREGFAKGGSPIEFENKKEEAMLRVNFLNQELSRIAKEMDAAPNKENKELKEEYEAIITKKSELIPLIQSSSMEQYMKLAGEVEARDVADRADLTKEDRISKQPYASQGIAVKDMIVRSGSGRQMSSDRQEKIKEFAVKNKSVIIESYASKHGNLISNDLMKKEFEPVGYTGEDSIPYQKEAGNITKEYLNKVIAANKGTGKEFIITTGGTGSGKSTAIAKLADENNIILDVNLTKSELSAQTIQHAIDNGLKPSVVFVLRDPRQAYAEGVIKRSVDPSSIDYKRVIGVDEHLKIHEQARKTFDQLRQKFGDFVNFRVLDNRGAEGVTDYLPLENFDKISYPYNESKKELEDYVRSEERIPEESKALYLRQAGDVGKNTSESVKQQIFNKDAATTVSPGTPQEVNLSNIVKDVQSETIQAKAQREIEEFASMPNGKKSFGFSPDVNQFLKSKENVKIIEAQLSQKMPSSDLRKIVNSNVGVKRKSPSIKITERAALKRELQQEQVASKQGEREGRSRAISELKNLFNNQTIALKRKAELQRLKDDMIARDKSGAELATTKAKMTDKLDSQKREAELQRLEDDMIARDKVRVKKEIIAYAKEKLPVDVQGKYLTAIGNAHTASHLSSTFRRIDEEVKNIERQETINQLKAESKKALESGKVAVEYKKMIEEITGGIELKKRRPETLDRLRRTREHIEKQRAAGKDVEMPDRILKQLEILHRESAEKLTVAELKNILANVQDLTKLGETKLRSREAIYEMQKERIKADLIKGTMALEKNPILAPMPGEKLTFKESFGNFFSKTNNMLMNMDLAITPMDTFFDIMDGGSAKFDGPNYRLIKKALDVDYQSYLRISNKYFDEAVKLAKELKLSDQNFERIGVHAARMQKDGFQKLLDTGLTKAFIDKIELTADEMKFYKMMRKTFDELRPAVADTMKNVYNEPLGEVENYVSFMTDFDKLSETEIFRRVGDNAPEQVARPTKETEKGFTKKRVGGYQPIKLNAMDIYLKHVDNVAYLINMSKDLKMIFEVVNSPEYGKVAGDFGQKLTLEWLDLMSRKGGLAGEQRAVWLDALRRNFGLAQLGLNATSALIQPTALLDGAAVIGEHAFDGLFRVIGSKKVRTFVLENMPEIKSRLGDDPNFVDFNERDVLTKLQEKAAKVGYWPLRFFDGLTAMGVANGAYIMKMKELGLKVDLNNPNKEAINYAQEIVRRTQSSQHFKDSPLLISKGKILSSRSLTKAVLQFQSFMLNRWSQVRNHFWRAKVWGGRGKIPGDRDFNGAFLFAFMMIMALSSEQLLRRGSREALDKATGKHIPENKKTSFSDDFWQGVFSTIPLVGQTISTIKYENDIIPSFGAVRSTLEAIGSTGESIKNKIEGKKVDDKPKVMVDLIAGIAGTAVGVPGTAQLKKIAKSEIDSNSKDSVISMYEQALRTKDKDLLKKANESANKNNFLIKDMQKSAVERVTREMADIYERALEKKDRKLVEEADAIANGNDYLIRKARKMTLSRRKNETKKDRLLDKQREGFRKLATQ